MSLDCFNSFHGGGYLKTLEIIYGRKLVVIFKLTRRVSKIAIWLPNFWISIF